MKVTSKVFTKELKNIDSKAKQSLVMTADALKSDVIQSQTMPFDTGEMQNRSTFVDDSNISKGEARVVTSTPYARKMYFHPEYNFQKDKNPHAGGLWFDPYVSGNKKDFVPKTFAKFMKGKM